MVKLSRIFSIICFALVLSSLTMFFVYLFNQDKFIAFFAGKAVLSAPFIFPVSIFIKVLTLVLSGVLLFIVGGKVKTGVWGEIVTAVFVSCGTVAIEWLASMYQSLLMGQMGSEALAAYSAIVSGFSIASVFNYFVSALIMFTCGLSLTAKLYEKRRLREML